jgi:hypothetical protein
MDNLVIFKISLLNLDNGSLLPLYLSFTTFLSIIIPCDLPLEAFPKPTTGQRTIHRYRRLLVLGFEEQVIGMVSEFLASSDYYAVRRDATSVSSEEISIEM